MIRFLKKVVRYVLPGFYHKLTLTKVEVFSQYRNMSPTTVHKQRSLLTYLWNYIVSGVTPEEYEFLSFSLLNRKGKANFVTMRRNRKLNGLFNDEQSNRILNDKGRFNEYFSGFIKRRFLFIDTKTTDQQLSDFYLSLKNKMYIIKPNNLYYGLGIHVGNTLEELFEVRDAGAPVVVEEHIKNDSTLAKLNDSSLNTFRVVTCIDSHGDVYILAFLLRTGRKGALIDNLLGGGTCYHVDIETGVIDGAGRDSIGNYYVKHPTSEKIMPGFQIPHFDELKEYAVKLAKHLPNARYVGWDIALTPDGIEVIEGNICPSAELIQCNNIGLYKQILNYY